MRTFLRFTSIFLTLGSAILVARGSVALTPQGIAELATSKWDYNPEVIGNLAQQKVDTAVGVVLLLLAFALQMLDVLRAVPSGDAPARRGPILGALAASAVLVVGALLVANARGNRTGRAATEIAKEIVRRAALAPGTPEPSKPP